MADKTATLKVILKDLASRGTKALRSAMNGLKTTAAGVGIAIGGLTAFLVKSVKAFGVQEAAVARLENAMRNVKGASADGASGLIQFAGELQKVTSFGDEQIISAQAMLATFQLNEKQIRAITPRLLDMAAATEKTSGVQADLEQIAIALGKGFTGQIGTLSRYGVVLDEQKVKTEGFSGIIESLDNNFKGAAEAGAKTLQGQVKSFGNAFGDLQEQIGAALADQLLEIVTKLKNMSLAIQENKVAIGQFANGVILAGEIATEVFTFLGESIANLSFALIEMVQVFIELAEGDWAAAWDTLKNSGSVAIDSLVETRDKFDRKITSSVDKFKKNNKKLVDNDKKTKKALQKTAVEDDKFEAERKKKKAEDEAKALEKLNKEKLKASAKNREQVVAFTRQAAKDTRTFTQKFSDDLQQIRTNAQKDRVRSMGDTFGQISTLTQSSNKTLFAIGKAAAIAQALISIPKGIAQALGAAPPPVNFALAAAVGAAGAVQIASIAGVNLQEGGIVLPRPGGTIARIGEAGQAEAVIPLEDADEGLGGFAPEGSSINISIGTFVGNEEGIDQLATMLDEKFFDLQRNNESITF